MLGSIDEYTAIALAPITAIASSTALSASCFDATEYTGIGALKFYAGSCVSTISCTVVLQYMDQSIYASVLSVAQADASGTWAACATQPFTLISGLAVTSQTASINWDMVEGKYLRLLVTNNQTTGVLTAAAVAFGRKQDA